MKQRLAWVALVALLLGLISLALALGQQLLLGTQGLFELRNLPFAHEHERLQRLDGICGHCASF